MPTVIGAEACMRLVSGRKFFPAIRSGTAERALRLLELFGDGALFCCLGRYFEYERAESTLDGSVDPAASRDNDGGYVRRDRRQIPE